MSLFIATVIVLAEAQSPAVGLESSLLAQTSPRPLECQPSLRLQAWQRARAPSIDRYCDLLGQGYARLPRTPSLAVEAANAAERVLPGQLATLQLLGRASLALGDADRAYRELSRAGKAEVYGWRSPAALHDFARAAALTGHDAEALKAYRQLISRVSKLQDDGLRVTICLEAAMLAMKEGRAGLAESVGLLTGARRRTTVPGFTGLLTAALALALDRWGQSERARALVGEIEGPEGLARWVEPSDQPTTRETARVAGEPRMASKLGRIVLPPGEADALIAMAAERDSPGLALARWRTYLSRAVGPWLEHARSKANQLEGRGRATRRR